MASLSLPPHATHASVLKPPGLLAFRGGHRRRGCAPPSVLVQMRWGSVPNRGFWTKISLRQEVGSIKASSAGYTPGEDDIFSEGVQEFKVDGPRTTFIAKLAVALGIAATITVVSICLRRPTLESSSWIPTIIDSSSASVPNVANAGFTFSLFKYKIILPEYTPGWIYFWLLMAAGCGLFISEEALNVWVGISLARMLSLDGTWKTFVSSFSNNAPYIMSTFLWVYWGVCISDMIPYYVGRIFRRTKASSDICSQLGIGKEKAIRITRAVQKYGNLIGFVERFSIGMRNPTAFLAGTLGISSECFFAGVCCGGLITLPIQLAIGFLLRERPVVALTGVATAVGMWTVFPYLLAASTAIFLFLRRRYFS